MRYPARRSSARGGFTLLELIVVVAILSLVAAMAWPSIRKMYLKGEIEDAAKQVRDSLVRARLKAIETGTTQVFQFQAGTGRFEVVAKAAADGEPDSTAAGSDETGLGDLLDPSSLGEPMAEPLYAEPTWETLGHKVRFAGQDLDDRMMALVGAAEDANPLESPLSGPTDQDFSESGPVSAGSGMAGDGQWSVPIVFYPNGRTSNARIRLTDQDEYYVDVSLRGLTGGARISKVRRWRERTQDGLTGTVSTAEVGSEFGLLEEVPLEVIR